MVEKAPVTSQRRALAVAALGLMLLGVLGWVGARSTSGQRASANAPIGVAAATRPSEAASSSVRDASSPVATTDARVALGRKMFFDPALSEPAGTSCASCHDPAHGYAGNNGSPIGVAQGSAVGRFAQRNTPSVLYLRFVRRFHLEWEEEAELPEAFGGFFWDGRASTVATVVTQPLLNPNEMGNRNPRQIADKLRTSTYAAELAAEFDHVFDTPDSALEALGFCLEAFLISPQMSPFSSKYDEYLRGHRKLSEVEAKGLALFDDPNKAACSSCHKFDAHSRLPEASLFTDYGYDTVSVPRNRALPSNRDPKHFDLGLCARRDRKLHTEDEWFCGSFRTPSLRNVATRASFMHNGVFSKLRDVVSFYATRGSDPKRWYPNGAFDDLPTQYQKYVNVNVAPYNQAPGDPPALSDQEIDEIVAFLETLSDAPSLP
jgi:cytochrome c peroxidase